MKKNILIVVAVILLLCLANPFVAAAPQESEESDSIPSPAEPESTDPPEPTPTPIYFEDVQPDDWFFECVTGIHDLGMANGTGDGLYHPDQQVTWAEVIAFLLRGMGVTPGDPEPGMKWGDVYLAPAKEKGLINSSWDTELLYTPINRLDAAHLTARSLTLIPISGPTPFTDCDEPDVTELYEKGILAGIAQPDGTLIFNPEGIFTRAEISSILWKTQTVDYTKGMVRIRNRWVDVFDNILPNPFTEDDFIKTVDGVEVTAPPEPAEGEEAAPAAPNPRARVTYTKGYAVTGIDVSEFMGEIDWPKVKADGIDFVMVRIGGRLMMSGNLFEDKYFKANVEGAKAAGLDVGVYFFSQALNEAEGLEEANYVLGLLNGTTLTYPVVCDWEFLGGAETRTWTSTPREVTDGIEAFCRTVEAAGYRAGVYFNEYCGILKMDLSRLSAYPFWYAQYADYPTFLYNFQMWQYSGGSRVDGIKTEVDVDLCFVEDLYAPIPTPEPPAETEDPDAEQVEPDPNATAPEADPNATEAPTESVDGTEPTEAPTEPAEQPTAAPEATPEIAEPGTSPEIAEPDTSPEIADPEATPEVPEEPEPTPASGLQTA